MALRPLFLLMTLSLGTSMIAGEAPDDLHLAPDERTPDEQARVLAITRPTVDFTTAELFEQFPAGAASIPATSSAKLFKSPSANMGFDRKMEFILGEALFEKLWVSAPSSTKASDGVGPLYNARSCARCHPNAGRGRPPQSEGETLTSMFLRLSIPDDAAVSEIEGYLATLPDPVYGRQLQNISVGGLLPEGKVLVSYTEIEVALAGGETAHLRAPTYDIQNLGYGPLHPDVMISPRVAPQMIGLGLLEAIPARDIIANADPEDADGDGISGRVQIIMSPEYDAPMLGRFGLKAGAATVYQQSAGAFHGDIGISTPLFPAGWGECTKAQTGCRAAPDGNSAINGDLEIPAEGMNAVSFYAQNLAVPVRRNSGNPSVLRGKRLFYETGCSACHRPKFFTHRLPDRPEQSFQLIWPYTDLLLHDMGQGLADHRPEGRATGSEWRTAPLWGIGWTKQVSGHSYFLHDGRARNLLEAVLWHGGEAEVAKQKVTQMPKSDRDALIDYLESL